MKVGIVKEVFPGERRVAGVAATVKWLKKMGFDVVVETGAGVAADCPDEAYLAEGAELGSAADVWSQSDIVFKVGLPQEHPELGTHEADLLRDGATLLSFLRPAQNDALVDKFKGRPVNVIAMDQVPRISRAQKLDALSSMANLAGYRAVVEAANNFGRFFTGQVTAAGKVPPAKVLVIGAGVAGLAAIGAARAMGAIVRAFDTRPEVKDQVASMGAVFLELEFEEDGTGEGGYAKVMSPEFIKAEMALFLEQAKEVDIIITTALIPGRRAPILIDKEMVEAMKPGSVVVDLAAEMQGNCEYTIPGEINDVNGVKIIGYTDLASRMSGTASHLYGNNLCYMLDEMGKAEGFAFDMENEIVRGATVIHEGEMIWPAPKKDVPAPKLMEQKDEPVRPPAPTEKELAAKRNRSSNIVLGAIAAALMVMGAGAPTSFLQHLEVFVLAIIIGYMVIWNVSAALHTPLMAVTNAISGIIVIAGMLQISGEPTHLVTILGAIAVFVATINVSGGFLVTHRMLKMFRK